MWRAIRWPLVALFVGGAMVLLAYWLDTGSSQSRDAALLVGVAGAFVLLPVAVVWLLVALVLHLRHR